MVRSAVGVAVVVYACLGGTGCMTDGQSVLSRVFSPDTDGNGWKKVKTPREPKIPAAHIATAQRVELLGNRIIAQNTFTGIEPLFFTLDVPESVLFHRGTEELFISGGLVAKCKSEDQLAAILCNELGQMMAEKRGAKRTGNDRDTIPDAALPGGNSLAGGVRADAGRDAENAFRERRDGIGPKGAEPADSAKLARDLMQGAGFDPTELERIEPLLKQTKRGTDLRKQMSSSAAPPKWDR